MKVLIATKNPGKLKEFQSILESLHIDFTTLKEFDDCSEPLENGETLIENALIKAKYYYDLFKIPVIADDTGLFVESLNYQPGIKTARYSGGSDKDNRIKLLNNLIGKKRDAYFETSLIFYDGKNILTGVGRLHGFISEKEQGDHGFGYDSVFIPKGFNNTFAELDSSIKNHLSHRFLAISNLKFKLDFFLKNNTHEKFINNLIYDLTNAYPSNIIKLHGGMSNDTYLIEVNGMLKTVRIPGNSDNLYVDRFNELESLNIVKDDLSFLQYEYFDSLTGVKVSPYIEENTNEIDFCKLGDVLEKLHSYVSNFTYEPITRLMYYKRLNDTFKVKLHDDFTSMLHKIMRYKDILISRPKRFCHNDNQLSNFIRTKNSYILIDFEFCGNNDPLFDYACFGNNDLNIGKIALEKQLNRNLTEEENKIIDLWYSIQALTWYLVATFKDVTGLSKTLNLNFDEIAKMFLNKAKNLLMFY